MVFLHQLFFQRTAVHPHTDRDIALPCSVYHCFDPVKASDISWIDADLVCSIFHSCNGHLIVKMNVCHQRNGDLLFDLLDRLCRLLGGYGTTDDLTTCFRQSVDLLYRRFYIFRSCICHGLDQDWIPSADDPVSNLHYFCMISIHLKLLLPLSFL